MTKDQGTTLVLGYGTSGKATERFLKHQNIGYAIHDDHLGHLKVSAGDLDAKKFDQVVVSPGIEPSHSLIEAAKKNQIPVRINADLINFPSTIKIIGITGTNGKSSFCAKLDFALNQLGYSSKIAGNFGTPLSEIFLDEDIEKLNFLVVELSSYQLFYRSKFKLDLGIILNLQVDHLQWHKTLKHYCESKNKISGLDTSEVLYSRQALEKLKEEGVGVDEALVKVLAHEDLFDHALQHVTQKPRGSCDMLLRDFSGLEHRLEVVSKNPRKIINDSKSTNCTSTIYALNQQKKDTKKIG